MCSCHSILECCVTFSGVKLSIRSIVLFAEKSIGQNEVTVINQLICESKHSKKLPHPCP